MTITIYVRDEALEDTILRIVDLLPGRIAANVCRSAKAFITTIRHSLSGSGIFIIACSDVSDLRSLYRDRCLFADRQVVVVLPPSNRQSSTPGFDLNARVVLYPEEARIHLAEILHRMIRRRQNEQAVLWAH